jgi:hypothetical protein
MIYKISIVLLCLFALAFSDPNYVGRSFISGDATNWTYYAAYGITQVVDISSYGLTKIPAIST